ncbi:uncharacterized protein LOC122071519 isoform X2 [Macadamia integrifolia]|uniref:uncharacterized protein LOC122071519 isoform X2 n=1 Tax=Macadamia integrifolia TaxID=60698 RepID=UPI001C4EDDD0|nr:uncharacterized protein LOC122071519 isoform X2 [Macadamia integrifolia]
MAGFGSGSSSRGGMLRVSEDENRRREGYLASYKQIRDSLIDLEHSADRIFDTISKRTAKENEKLMGLSKRIRMAKAKIEAISHKKESITIRSPSKYSSKSNGDRDFQTLFGYKDDETGGNIPVAKILVNGGLNREFGVDGTLELFQFFSETTPDFPHREVHPTVGTHVARSDGNPSIDNLPKPPHLTYGSLLKEDFIARDSSSSSKQQDLPPPPPSLLHGSQVPPRLEGFSLRPSVTHHSKQQHSFSDLPIDLNMALSGASSQAKPHLTSGPPSLRSLAKTPMVEKHQLSRDPKDITASTDDQNSIPPLHNVDHCESSDKGSSTVRPPSALEESSPGEGEKNDPDN